MKLGKYDIAYIVSIIILIFSCSAIVGGIAVEACYGDPKSPLCEEINK
jgi:hypothetical protein